MGYAGQAGRLAREIETMSASSGSVNARRRNNRGNLEQVAEGESTDSRGEEESRSLTRRNERHRTNSRIGGTVDVDRLQNCFTHFIRARIGRLEGDFCEKRKRYLPEDGAAFSPVRLQTRQHLQAAPGPELAKWKREHQTVRVPNILWRRDRQRLSICGQWWRAE